METDSTYAGVSAVRPAYARQQFSRTTSKEDTLIAADVAKKIISEILKKYS